MMRKHVVVCGAGLAGFAAAVTAQECGAHVTLLEKAPQPGGTTVLSGGLLWTFADYETLRAMVPHGDAALQWLVFDTIDSCRDWLRNLGATLGPVDLFLEHGRGQPSDPVQFIEVLQREFERRGGTLRVNCALDTLKLEGNAVAGVRALHRGAFQEFSCDAVVLATGGFQGNAELIARYVVDRPEQLVLRANPWSTGDGFLAATAAGAAVSQGLGSFYGHALPAAPARFGSTEFRDVSQYYGHHALALNLLGERFADESEETGEEAVNQWLARQPMGRGIYVVDDAMMALPPLQGRDMVTRTQIERARKVGASVVTAPSLEGLCQQLAQFGLPPVRTLQTIEAFNTAASDEEAAANLVPPRRRRRFALRQPPFTAVVVQAGITFTHGGLLVDDRLRVLRRSGSTSVLAPAPVSSAFAEAQGGELSIGNEYRTVAIEGLHAAGGDAGNISNFGYVGGLASALTTGRAAGRQAAQPSKDEP
jgi:succinate dehydrogenase/fumarate reductase flavoprotein subunit